MNLSVNNRTNFKGLLYVNNYNLSSETKKLKENESDKGLFIDTDDVVSIYKAKHIYVKCKDNTYVLENANYHDFLQVYTAACQNKHVSVELEK